MIAHADSPNTPLLPNPLHNPVPNNGWQPAQLVVGEIKRGRFTFLKVRWKSAPDSHGVFSDYLTAEAVYRDEYLIISV